MRGQQKGSDSWRAGEAEPVDEIELRRWRDLLETRTGICLPRQRQSYLLGSLRTRMRELQMPDYAAYYQYLHQGAEGEQEWQTLLDRFTVNETRFMRDEHALSLLSEYCLPKFLSSPDSDKSFNVWSAGCATGEEPYSIAMRIDDYLQKSACPTTYQVWATDISQASLRLAEQATYLNHRGKNLSATFRQRYIQPHDHARFTVNQTIRDKVSFSPLNLLELEKAALPLMDVIFCQNVLIYFKQACRQAILDHLVHFLKPGGVLILGAGEIFNWRNPLLAAMEFPGSLAFKRGDTVGHCAKVACL